MKVVQEVIGKFVKIGGYRAGDWLPANAAVPPIRESVLNVRILAGDGEFILEWRSSNGDFLNDSWHATIAEAQLEAKLHFGIEATEWHEAD